MEIGKLRHRITFQKLTIETDELGFQTEIWIDFKTVWAAVSNLSGREYFAAAAVQSENIVKFTFRYISEMDTTYRILFRGKTYNITAVDNFKYMDKYMEVKAQID